MVDETRIFPEDRSLPERRLTSLERRAGRRFITQLLERFPRYARIAYPVRGEEPGIVYVRMPIPDEQAVLMDEFAAALTGVIFDQEKIRVLLIPDEFSLEQPIKSDEELKVVQAQLSCDIDCLRKLRNATDQEALTHRQFYLQRYHRQTERIINYLAKHNP